MSDPVNFPNIVPTGRRYDPGVFPQTEFQANNGSVSIIRFGNKRVNSRLQLEFNNITDEDAGKILRNYQQVNSDWDYVRFQDDDGAAGIDDEDLEDYIREAQTGLRWRYDGPPRVTSTFPGRSSVSCSFRGFRDAD